MREGHLQQKGGCLDNGCFKTIGIVIIVFFVGVVLWSVGDMVIGLFKSGQIFNPTQIMALIIFLGTPCLIIYLALRRKPKKRQQAATLTPDSVCLGTVNGTIVIDNPFRGFFVLGAAGSGKSESIAVPLLNEFIKQGFAGVVYDFKFPALANDVQTFINANRSDLRHFFLNFNNPLASHRINPLRPEYLQNTSYAREYAQALINNLMKESIKKPDFWSRSAVDLLTACIWYLKEERPDICDLPHVCAMITSKDTALLSKLQQNVTTAQMTISIFNAMERGAEGQTAGVIGTLQGAIAQINTAELMYIFGGNDFSLDINNPAAPCILTVGSYPTLVTTLAPLCALVITVATKLMNQPNKQKSFVMLDEAPTCFVPNLEILPNTGRSNKVATVLMCQDLAQFTDGYGKEKADVLFASCNNHFYGRVASSLTSETLSKQFGKRDKVYITASEGKQRKLIGYSLFGQVGASETVQERDIIKPAEFLSFGVGEFAGITVESNAPNFRAKFHTIQRTAPTYIQQRYGDINGYYKQVRHDINKLLDIDSHSSHSGILNNTQTNSKNEEKGNPFDMFGD